MRYIRDFVEKDKKPKEIISHYKFNYCPNSAKGELGLFTPLFNILMRHVTIELRAIDYGNHKIQNWIRGTVMPRMAPDATIVIVVKP